MTAIVVSFPSSQKTDDRRMLATDKPLVRAYLSAVKPPYLVYTVLATLPSDPLETVRSVYRIRTRGGLCVTTDLIGMAMDKLPTPDRVLNQFAAFDGKHADHLKIEDVDISDMPASLWQGTQLIARQRPATENAVYLRELLNVRTNG